MITFLLASSAVCELIFLQNFDTFPVGFPSYANSSLQSFNLSLISVVSDPNNVYGQVHVVEHVTDTRELGVIRI
jgi:hypothetical protein